MDDRRRILIGKSLNNIGNLYKITFEFDDNSEFYIQKDDYKPNQWDTVSNGVTYYIDGSATLDTGFIGGDYVARFTIAHAIDSNSLKIVDINRIVCDDLNNNCTISYSVAVGSNIVNNLDCRFARVTLENICCDATISVHYGHSKR